MIIKVNSRNQVTLSKSVRDKLNIKIGDELLLDLQDGILILIPIPTSYTDHLQGLRSEIWKDVDAKKYVESERKSW